MTEVTRDVVGIGNAIVDVVSQTTDEFLVEHGLEKGIMTLIDAEQAESIYDHMGPAIEVSGGSAANTIAGLAMLGGKAGFVGKVAADQLGAVFAHDIRSLNVDFQTQTAESGTPTARCLVLVTADAQRTMPTYLGAAQEVGPADVDPDMIASAKITYLEGYLWDPEGGKAAFRKAMQICKQQGKQVSLSLSDPFCVDRHRQEFLDLVQNHVDILFANEQEITSLFQVDDFDAAAAAARDCCAVAALTRSADGSLLVGNGETHQIAAAAVDHVVDTTGAGDLYAAGVLYGLTQNLPLPVCGNIGAAAAAEVIQHYGARPKQELKARITKLLD